MGAAVDKLIEDACAIFDRMPLDPARLRSALYP